MPYINNAIAVLPTRLYFTNAAAPYDPATERGAWDVTASYTGIKISSTRSGATTTKGNTESNTTNNWDILQLKAVSDGLPTGLTISGNVQWIIGCLESAAGANCFLHVHIFVTAGDSDTVRGTLLTDFIGANEFATTAQGEGDGNQALSSVAATAGDRIVVEIGARFVNVSATAFTSTLNYGGTSGSDLAQSDTNVTTKEGWIEFDMNIGL